MKIGLQGEVLPSVYSFVLPPPSLAEEIVQGIFAPLVGDAAISSRFPILFMRPQRTIRSLETDSCGKAGG